MTTRIVFVALAFFLLNISCCQAQSDKKCDADHVCFALDGSGSIGDIYPDVSKFVVDAATGIDNLTSATFSAVQFESSLIIIQPPTSNLKTFVTSVTNSKGAGGGTNMYVGVEQCYKYVENKPGNRVIVLVTDGLDGSSPSAKSLIDSKSATGVAIVSVGIGDAVDAVYLKSLSDVYEPVSTTTVGTIGDLLRKSICSVEPGPKDPSKNTCQEAYKKCDFKFSGKSGIPTFSITGKPDKSFTPLIVSKTGPRIGVLNTNGIVPEFINGSGKVIPITSVGTPKLTPTHFKPFPVPKTVGSGIGHQTFTGNQLQVSRKRCVRVYFSTYQTLTPGSKPKLIENVNVKKSDNKCVVFKTA